MNRRGAMYLNDIGWFLLLLVIIFGIYFIGFKGLQAELSQNKIETSRLTNDGAFIAVSLAKMPVDNNGETYTSLIQDIAAQYKSDPTKLLESSSYKTYVQKTDELFAQPQFFEAYTNRLGIIVRTTNDIVVWLTLNGQTIPGTCADYSPKSKSTYLCDSPQLDNNKLEDNGAFQISGEAAQIKGLSYEHGTAAIPTENGLVILHVAVLSTDARNS